jgi:hypothetical protein
MLSNGSQRRGGTDPFGPVCATDEGGLGRVHHLSAADHRRDGVAVADRLVKYRNIRLDAEQQVRSTRIQTESGRDFVNHQHCAGTVGDAPHLLQESGLRRCAADRLHHDRGQRIANPSGNRFQFVYTVVVKRNRGSLESSWHARRAQTFEKVTTQRVAGP